MRSGRVVASNCCASSAAAGLGAAAGAGDGGCAVGARLRLDVLQYVVRERLLLRSELDGRVFGGNGAHETGVRRRRCDDWPWPKLPRRRDRFRLRVLRGNTADETRVGRRRWNDGSWPQLKRRYFHYRRRGSLVALQPGPRALACLPEYPALTPRPICLRPLLTTGTPAADLQISPRGPAFRQCRA